ncbi:BadF/BadG/BcrA/BcrD ATPase family protein [Rhodobacter ferrooxidans]|uniref:ATPase BadF/BadG/BcrA/BcrD type n=1 Tax=Rhodobacter ferrooxidans TaxID=371731 RepID=C8RWZ5_9RHOB|nr:BadF/BadG/BcrA/BcrD ATPase family protein [Rhodobacter sp. SW2]EEW26520.1 ATPase BadF/BadG/BcrA/BcrD type [Rhodobacter sp. SW2]
MALFLGIDGGGTKCRAAIADASGRILGQAQTGSANIASNADAARDNILAATTQALTEAIGAQGVAAELPRLTAVMGLAGANIPSSSARLQAALPFAARIISDAVIAVKGALLGGDGVVASLGTGSVFAVQRAGVVRQIGGWGFILGDEGSGAWLGRALLSRALRSVDGLVPQTPLLTAVIAELGGPDRVVTFARDSRPADFAGFALRIAASDDVAAREIMTQAEADVGAAIALLQGDRPVPLVFLGGLGASYAPRFAGRYQIAEPLGSALNGALWLARQGGA